MRSVSCFITSELAFVLLRSFAGASPHWFIEFVGIFACLVFASMLSPCLCVSVSLWLSLSPDRITAEIQHIHLCFQKAINRVARRADNRLVLVE